MDEFLYDASAYALGHSVGQTPIDVRYFQAFDAIVQDAGAERNALYLESSLPYAFCHDGGEESLFVAVEVLAHFLYHDDIAEELCSEIAVALYGFFYHVEVCVDNFDEFVFGLHLLHGHLVNSLVDTLYFSFDDSPVNFLFVLEIGIERTPTFARSLGNVVHCGVLQSVLGEQLACHVH